VLVLRVGRDQLREPLGVRGRRAEALEHEPDPGLSAEQAGRMVVLGLVRNVLAVEVRDVVALELGEPSSLQLVEGADHPSAADVGGAETYWLVVVLRVRRPAVVERSLGLRDDPFDRGFDRERVPGLVDERLVILGIEEGQR
jgi:hypothetical protein